MHVKDSLVDSEELDYVFREGMSWYSSRYSGYYRIFKMRGPKICLLNKIAILGPCYMKTLWFQKRGRGPNHNFRPKLPLRTIISWKKRGRRAGPGGPPPPSCISY